MLGDMTVLGILKWGFISTVPCDHLQQEKPLPSIFMTESVVKSSQKTEKFKSFRIGTCHPPSGQLKCSLTSHSPNTMGAFQCNENY